MIKIDIVDATPDHAASIAPRMRKADAVEVYARARRTPQEALETSLRYSRMAKTVFFDDQPEIIFGVGTISILSQLGCPWMLGTDAVQTHFRVFCRETPYWVSQLFEGYDILRNVVHEENRISRRWLGWLGFEFSDPFPLGQNGELFRSFEMRQGNVRLWSRIGGDLDSVGRCGGGIKR